MHVDFDEEKKTSPTTNVDHRDSTHHTHNKLRNSQFVKTNAVIQEMGHGFGVLEVVLFIGAFGLMLLTGNILQSAGTSPIAAAGLTVFICPTLALPFAIFFILWGYNKFR